MGNYISSAPCLFFSSKDDGTLVEVNETLCQRLGYTKEELAGRKIEDIFTIATRIFQQTHFFPMLKMHGVAEEIFITLLAKNKDHIPVLISAERIVVDGETITMHAGIVVHNRKKFEDELIAAKKSAEAALNENTALIRAKEELHKHLEELDRQINLVNKQNEELKQFNRVVTHDLQEPLRKVFVFSNLLLNEEMENQETIIERLIRSIEQMRSIISGLQQYVWLTDTDIKGGEIHLDKLFLVVKQQLEKEYPDINLIIDTAELLPVTADWEQMQLLFYQLLDNVIRFRKPGQDAYVKVSVQDLMLNQFRSIKNKYKYTRFFRIQLEDRGIGFDPAYKEQAFGLFKRLHSTSGRGVGLALCKKIIENHHGEIFIDSIKDEGTRVTIHIPEVESANAELPKA